MHAAPRDLPLCPFSTCIDGPDLFEGSPTNLCGSLLRCIRVNTSILFSSPLLSFAEQVQHVPEVNDVLAAAILAEEIPRELQPEVIDAVKTKQRLIDLARKSSVFVHRVFAATNENNARVVIKHPILGFDTSRLWLCSVIVGHSMDHYGQMVAYLRMNEIVPPASKP